jgi:radical SAM superfamily enzyme YgiQ (UPF0313 family)
MKERRIVLVSLNMSVDIDFVDKTVSRFIPEGLLYLATPLIAAGFDVRICDLAKDKLEGFKADVFGITGLPNQFLQMKKAIESIRRDHPKAKIILGGPLVSCAIEWIQNLLDFDLAIVGEGEAVIVSAVYEVLHGAISKKIVRADHLLEGRDFFRPSLELIDLKWYLNGRHRIMNFSLPRSTINNLMLSRGCPKSCNFCRQPFGKKVRVLPKEIVDFILESYARVGARSIRFQDDNWQYLSAQTRRDVLSVLSKFGLQVAFNSRVDDFSDEFAKEISAYGVVKQISFGVESLSQKGLNDMRKGTSVEQIKRAVRLCQDHGIEPLFFIMVGAPGETEESIATTLELIESEMVFALFTWFLPIPSTMYWDDFLKHHSAVKALSMFEGWDFRQNENDRPYNITQVPDGRLLEYYSGLKTLQERFSCRKEN